MLVDLPYRIFLLIAFGGGLAISGALRRRADEAGGSVPRSADRPGTAVALRIGATVFYGALLLWLAYPPLLDWTRVSVPAAWRWTGAGLILGGMALGLWALWHLGSNVTPTAVPRPDAELVTSGPYRWVRHPLYSSMLLTLPGCGLLTGDLLVFGGGAATFAVILWRTRREEEELVRRFGDRYEAYRRGTGRILPRIG